MLPDVPLSLMAPDRQKIVPIAAVLVPTRGIVNWHVKPCFKNSRQTFAQRDRHDALDADRTELTKVIEVDFHELTVLFQRRHLDLGPRPHLGERLHVTKPLRPDIAGARQPRFFALRDRRAPEPDGDGMAVRPIGDFARRDHRARVRLTLCRHGDLEINLFAPGQDRARERQRSRNGVRGRRVKKLRRRA
jgi:hypothetical protein